MNWYQREEPYVASVEVLVTMSDGSAHSLATTDGSIIESCSFNMRRAEPPDFGWEVLGMAPTPVVELGLTVDGLDIRFVRQYHPAPKEDS